MTGHLPASRCIDRQDTDPALEEGTRPADRLFLARARAVQEDDERRARAARALSDAWGQLLVAQGSADALLERPPCFEWDWAAPSLIVAEAGGRVSTLAGADPAPGCDLLVTNGRVHDEILDAASSAR